MDRFLATGSCKKRLNEVDSVTSSTSSVYQPQAKKKVANRQYDKTYITFGFSCFQAESNNQRPQCVLCYEILANDSMRPCKLKRHLETKHPECVGKVAEFFIRREQELKKQQTFMSKESTVNKSALMASYVVSLRIAKSKSSHTIGESLLLPAAVEMCEIMIGKSEAKKLKTIPLSNDTVRRRIDDLANNVQKQLVNDINSSPFFSLQLDESTDISNLAQLLCYVRYINKDGKMAEEFLFCKELPTRTTGKEIFKILDEYVVGEGLDWRKCFGLCTDGAAAMTGKYSGLATRVKEVAPAANWTHCMIHREALAAKKLQPAIHHVFTTAVKIVNFIKSRAMNERCFAVLCEEMGSDYTQLLFHSEVRWLSRGKVLQRLFELRTEVRLFLMGKTDLAENLVDEAFLATLAYLADVFDKLNSLNLTLLGGSTTVLCIRTKIRGFMKKLVLWKSRIEASNTEMFPLLNEFLEVEAVSVTIFAEIKDNISEHLEGLQKNFKDYFPDAEDTSNDWVLNPFTVKVEALNLPIAAQENILDLTSDSILKASFTRLSLSEFWISIKDEYTDISHEALKIIVQFPTSYLCEAGFSAMVKIKTKYRYCLSLENDLRLALTHISPEFEKLCSAKQAHLSH